MYYNAKLTQERGRWLVEFPDCPGCQTFGESKDEAIEMAHEALDGWLETSLEHGDVPPRPAAQRGVPVAVRPRLDVAIQLRWWREDLGLTQGELAKRIGVSQQQIAKLENPAANPTIDTLATIAHKMDADLIVTIAPRRGPKAAKASSARARRLRRSAA
jgi:antitoxin HicB